MKLRYVTFEFDDAKVIFYLAEELIIVYRNGDQVGRIPNPRKKWGGARLKPRTADAIQAIREAVPPEPKLVASNEPKRKKTKYAPPTRLKIAER